MERRIADKILYQRTEYSKPRLFSSITGKDITEDYLEEVDKMIRCYKDQTLNPEKYFGIYDNAIIGIMKGCNDVNYLFVPDGITVIEKEAFRGGIFEHLSLPDSIEKISNFAFVDCMFLDGIYIPDSVRTIGYGAFNICGSLSFIHLPEGLHKIEGKAFYDCVSLKYIHIPDTVKVIGEFAFSGCRNLENIHFPASLQSIGDEAFERCSRLENVNLPYGLKIMNHKCFMDCRALKEIYLPDSITHLHSKSFAGCISLEMVELSKSLSVIESETFDGCMNLKRLILPDNICGIGNCILSGTENLESINLPEKLDFIDNAPLSYSSLRTITINHDLTNLKSGQTDLLDKSNICELIISKDVKKITPNAFKYSGNKIREIEYDGTKDDFERFKNSNKELFDCFKELKNVNFTKSDKEKSASIEELTY